MANSMVYGITLSAVDKTSGIVEQITKRIEQLSSQTQRVNERMESLGNISLTSANSNMSELADGANRLTDNMGGSDRAAKGLLQSLTSSKLVAGGLAAVLAGATFQAITNVVRASIQSADEFSRMYSRLGMINDGLQTTEELNQAIYRSAQTTRSEYRAVADQVGKLGMLAGDAFQSTSEIVDFVTEMNRQFKLGGAGIQEQTAAMYQLTQAMASGRLQGDEFRSIIENAPLLAKAITKYMGVSQAELKKLASEGAITADVIKNALQMSASESAKAFSKLPTTFAEHMTTLQNAADMAFIPLKRTLADVFSSAEFAQGIALMANALTGAVQVMIGAIGLLKGAWVVMTGAGRIAWSVIQTGMNIVASMLPLLVGGLVSYVIYTYSAVAAMAAWNGAIAIWNARTMVWAGLMATKNALTVLWTTLASGAAIGTNLWTMAQNALNIAMLANPIGFVIALIAGLITVIYLCVEKTIGWREVFVVAWELAVDTVQLAVNGMLKALNVLIGGLNYVGEAVAKVFNREYTAVGTFDMVDFSGVKGKGSQFIRDFSVDSLFTMPSFGGANGLPAMGGVNSPNSLATQIAENTGRTADNTAQAKDLLELTQDEIDRMRNVADKEAIARFTNQEIKIVVTNHNQVSSDADIDGMGDSIARQLMRALRVAPEGV